MANRNGKRQKIDISAIFDRREIGDTFRISFLGNFLVLPVYDQILREYGLNRGEYLLLLCLSQFDELTAQDVAKMTARPRNTISRAVHRMLQENYLERSPHPTDGRQILLRITEKGRQLQARTSPKFRAREEELLAALSKPERATFDRLLKKLTKAAAQEF